ncbi:glycosyltransferase family 2 protein [Psychroserpens sp. MEBiC05023]
MKTTAIIVTYSNRFNLLTQVVDACLKEGVSKFIIVDNNSVLDSKNSLRQLQEELGNSMHVIWNDSNEGSAKAFKQGLEFAKDDKEVEYLWLLDDDNKPENNALNELYDFWLIKEKSTLCLVSYRPDRSQYKDAVLSENPDLVLGWTDSFYGFHLFDKLRKIVNPKPIKKSNKNFGRISYAPYGGMFFHKSLIDAIGFPNEDFFLYSDDHDWSYRITHLNKKIVLLLDSVVNDIDSSWYVSKKKKNVFQTICSGDSFRIYYTIRNRMVFEKKYLIQNPLIYNLNKLCFTSILYFYCRNNSNFKIFINAINAAKNNKLGNNYENINS